MPNKLAKDKINNSNLILSVVAAVLVALPVGYIIGDSSSNNGSQDHSHSDEVSASETAHAHEMLNVESSSAPEISTLDVEPDSKSGWNIHFTTKNFKFAPEKAGKKHVVGEGHAHLYIDGEKITRLYSNNYYLGDLSEGEHEIKITLNTNDHKEYAVSGETVESTYIITDSHHSGG